MGENQTKISEEPEVVNSLNKIDQLKALMYYANIYLNMNHHIEALKQMSTGDDIYDVGRSNFLRWRALKEGSYYLGNVYNLMTKYMEYVPDNKFDENMESVIETMTALGFDISYNTGGFTDAAYNGEVECFVSKGKGTMYYKLLHSKYKEDIRFFLAMVKRDIDIPLRKFCKSIEEQLLSLIASSEPV